MTFPQSSPPPQTLILRGTGLVGPVPCSLVGDKVSGLRKSLVLSNNPDIKGAIDACFTSSPVRLEGGGCRRRRRDHTSQPTDDQ
jgi:hypothetical protein